MVDEIDFQKLKADEKAADSFESTPVRKKRREHKRKDNQAGEGKACGWHHNYAADWGLALLATGSLGLLAVAGYRVNWWALVLLLPGISGITSAVALARWQRTEGWVFWPLFGGLLMTVGGYSWALGLTWPITLAGLCIGSGIVLLWLDRVRRSRVA
jgi:hypothetical protein